MFVRESFEQLLSVTEDVPAFLITIAVENCDKVENFSAAKRVLGQMGPWNGPASQASCKNSSLVGSRQTPLIARAREPVSLAE